MNKGMKIILFDRYKMDVCVQQVELGFSDKIQYCMFSPSNNKFTQIAEANKVVHFSLFIALFRKVDALAGKKQIVPQLNLLYYFNLMFWIQF